MQKPKADPEDYGHAAAALCVLGANKAAGSPELARDRIHAFLELRGGLRARAGFSLVFMERPGFDGFKRTARALVRDVPNSLAEWIWEGRREGVVLPGTGWVDLSWGLTIVRMRGAAAPPSTYGAPPVFDARVPRVPWIEEAYEEELRDGGVFHSLRARQYACMRRDMAAALCRGSWCVLHACALPWGSDQASDEHNAETWLALLAFATLAQVVVIDTD